MDTASIRFVVFGLIVAVVSNFSSSRIWRLAVLLLSSLFFVYLLSSNPLSILPLAGFLLLGYACIALQVRGYFRSLISFSTAIIFAFLWLKKYTFLPSGMLLPFPYLTLGISYIFFRVLHLIIELDNNPREYRISLASYLAYTLNFTTLISGPIQRYEMFSQDMLAEPPIGLCPVVVGLQLERIIRGFFKVNVLVFLLDAVRLDSLAELSHPISAGFFPAFRLIVAYPLFLYANFSGYIDIVIALARLMRLRLPENFDRPFSATSFLELWSRWHITLSTWLKTYVYNPLLLTLMRRFPSEKVEPFLTVLCFFVTFFLVGIWHGRTSEFAMFGVLQGAGVAVNALWQVWFTRRMGRRAYKAMAAGAIYNAFGRGLTFSWFAFTMFWFWASWREIHTILDSLGPLQWVSVWIGVWLAATAVFELWERLRARILQPQFEGDSLFLSRYARVVYATALALASFIVVVLLDQAAPAIVYKAF